MPDYSKGKIYAIRSFKTDNVYIGSTTQTLAQRLGKHRKGYGLFIKGNNKFINSFDILKYDDEYIELVEEYPCNNKMQLCKREYEIMRETENCISKKYNSSGKKEDYSKGKIYIIKSPNTEKVYIGSTIQPLNERFSKHLYSYKTISKNGETSRQIIEYGDAYIELIEEYPCENVEQLRKREGEIAKSTENIVNRLIAGRTKKEYYEEHKEYLDNKKREWEKKNYEKIKEKRNTPEGKERKRISDKKYRDKNIDKIKEYDRKRTKKSQERNKQKITCRCGLILTKGYIAAHRKTKKHQNYIQSIE